VTRDAHTHLAAGAADLLDLDLREVHTSDQLAAALAEAVTTSARGRWIRGRGWDGIAEPADTAPHPYFWRAATYAAFLAPPAAQRVSIRRGLATEAAFSRRGRLLAVDGRANGNAEAARAQRFDIGAVDDMVG
jgi:hypothetical protein